MVTWNGWTSPNGLKISKRPRARRRTGNSGPSRPTVHVTSPRSFCQPVQRVVGEAVVSAGRRSLYGYEAVIGTAQIREPGRAQRVRRLRLQGGDGGGFRDDRCVQRKLKPDDYWVLAGGLEPAATATVVDGRGPPPVMTDGPYLETKEVIGGFWVVDVPDLDVALRLAVEGSRACRGKVGRGAPLRGRCLSRPGDH